MMARKPESVEALLAMSKEELRQRRDEHLRSMTLSEQVDFLTAEDNIKSALDSMAAESRRRKRKRKKR